MKYNKIFSLNFFHQTLFLIGFLVEPDENKQVGYERDEVHYGFFDGCEESV